MANMVQPNSTSIELSSSEIMMSATSTAAGQP